MNRKVTFLGVWARAAMRWRSFGRADEDTRPTEERNRTVVKGPDRITHGLKLTRGLSLSYLRTTEKRKKTVVKAPDGYLT